MATTTIPERSIHTCDFCRVERERSFDTKLTWTTIGRDFQGCAVGASNKAIDLCDECSETLRSFINYQAAPPGEKVNQKSHSTDYQMRVAKWMLACFGQEISSDLQERNHRFLEESLELVQSCGCTASEAHQLVDYVFGRPEGEIYQEVGGVMVTLAALCNAQATGMNDCAEIELQRIWTKVDQIREKHAAKPDHSPLPQ